MAAYPMNCPFCSLAGRFLICHKCGGPKFQLLALLSHSDSLPVTFYSSMALNTIQIYIPVSFLSLWISNSHPRVSTSKQELNSVHPNLNPHHLSKHNALYLVVQDQTWAPSFSLALRHCIKSISNSCRPASVSLAQSSPTPSFQNPE